MQKSDVGLIGLAVMGENLALNMESKGFRVSLYNRPHPGQESVVTRFLNNRGKGKNFTGTSTMEEFVKSIDVPRKILLMIKAGNPVDEVIAQLIPHLSAGDVIIDGGNSDFHDTERRVKELEGRGILFVGAGVSGGEEGALHGPSIMPGGAPAAWPVVKNLLQSIAAKLDDGTPCCEWIGKGGAGHYVKMVHNGIEYGDMQLIAEIYSILKKRLGLDNEKIAAVFEQWNQGELNSFLIEITARILRFRDENGNFLLDSILDAAGQKGTGKWSVIAALDEGYPLTLITEAVQARSLSAMSGLREMASKSFPAGLKTSSGKNLHQYMSEHGYLEVSAKAENSRISPQQDHTNKTEALKNALYASKLISYTQGFSLLKCASEHYGWELDYGMIARIWRNGCIIRSVFLEKITSAYDNDPMLENLLFDRFFSDKIMRALPFWRIVVAKSMLNGVPVPCMASALNYFDGLRTVDSSANLIQAQRDYFGAHMYERTDTARGRFFHTDWTGEGGDTVSGNYNA